MKKISFILLFVASAFGLVSCNSDKDSADNPFDTISASSNVERDKIIVISDLHLGNDLAYSENVKHLKRLEQFLNEVRSSNTIKELVIAGDMFDEWYIPTRVNTYGNGSQTDFVRKTVVANQRIFDVLNGIIKDRNVKVTYIPGNHDMGISPENVDVAMPGVNQARDKDRLAVGTYYPDGYPQIAIEHGHRYDFFCAMTPGANESEAPGSILPPGYFFARIAANSFIDPTTPEAATKVPNVKLNDPNNEEQNSKYNYYYLWNQVLSGLIYVKDNFDDKIITTNVGNYTKAYSINDILPRNNATDGHIEMNLYDGLFTQANWDDRERYNHALVSTNIDDAISGSLHTGFIDDQSYLQYFLVPIRSFVRLVVFGHTHLPMIKSYTNSENKSCVYANTGTWEDEKTRDKNKVIDQDAKNMHFVVILPMNSDKKKLQVALYQYKYGTHLLVNNKEVDL
ncbi:MAG: hypothetical protein GX416_10210 [Bacteroidales bacterium]|nr:hypothetical protein [Bacteroidales bacterium]